MKKVIVVILVLLFLVLTVISCQNKESNAAEAEKCEPKSEKKLEMYQMSEMAALMEQMYVDNKRLKERIQKGDTIGQFPQHFLRIHEAVMTDESDNDAFFKEQAAKFIKAQEMI
jgi:hypothetical protein